MPDGSHDWGFRGTLREEVSRARPVPIWRGKVVGGSSAVNDCVALRGFPSDYDEWNMDERQEWTWQSVVPAFRRAEEAMHVTCPSLDQLCPFQQAFAEAVHAQGIPFHTDPNTRPLAQSVGPVPTNVFNGVRWNSSFSYLDHVRHLPGLAIFAATLVDRLLFERMGRVAGLVLVRDGKPMVILGKTIVLAAGVYSSPLILMRSGIGDPKHLRVHGVPTRQSLPGVGRSLQEHPTVAIKYAIGPRFLDAAPDQMKGAIQSMVVGRLRSDTQSGIYDLHLFPFLEPGENGGPILGIEISLLRPGSRGAVAMMSASADQKPSINYRFLTERKDLAALVAGIRIARCLGNLLAKEGWVTKEQTPGTAVSSDTQIAEYVTTTVGIGNHGSSTCRMGTEQDALAVVDSRGRVRGYDNLVICDSSIFPSVPRANTNLPTAMVAERLAQLYLQR